MVGKARVVFPIKKLCRAVAKVVKKCEICEGSGQAEGTGNVWE